MRMNVAGCVGLLALSIWVTCAVGCAHGDERRRLPEPRLTSVPAGEGWIALLEGEHATKWKNVTDQTEGLFEIKDGVMHIFGHKPTRYFAYTAEPFGDFDLHVEFKVSPEANSGVFFRSALDDPVFKGMEIQVLDDYGNEPSPQGCGALYDVATPMFPMARPAGEWNSYDITCVGSQLKVVFNGITVLNLDLSELTMPIGKFDTPLAKLPQTGYIIIQDHGGEVWYRNVRIRKH